MRIGQLAFQHQIRWPCVPEYQILGNDRQRVQKDIWKQLAHHSTDDSDSIGEHVLGEKINSF